jgi:hypothetical protein
MTINAVNGIGWEGWIAQNPRINTILTTDNLSTVTGAGWLSEDDPSVFPQKIYTTDLWDIEYGYNPLTGTQTYGRFVTAIDSNGIVTLSQDISSGNVTLPVVSGNFASFQGTSGVIGDDGFIPSNPLLNQVTMGAVGTYTISNILVAGDVFGSSRAGVGVQATQINAPQGPVISDIAFTAGNEFGSNVTSGLGYGLRGYSTAAGMGGVTMSGINAAGGYDGISGGGNELSAIKAELSVGTLSVAVDDIVSPIISDCGSPTDNPSNFVSNISMFLGTNRTTAVIGQCFTLLGAATYFAKIDNGGTPSFDIAASGSVAGGTLKQWKVSQNGVDGYILVSGTPY